MYSGRSLHEFLKVLVPRGDVCADDSDRRRQTNWSQQITDTFTMST